MKFFINLVFALLFVVNYAFASCSIPGSTFVDVTDPGVSIDYIINANGPACKTVSSIEFAPGWDNIGTISGKTCNGFTVNFNQTIGTNLIEVAYEDSEGDEHFCQIWLETFCIPIAPEVSLTSLSCGGENNIAFTATVNQGAFSYNFSNLDGLTLLSSNLSGDMVSANFALDDNCDGGAFNFTYMNECGQNTSTHEVSRSYGNVGTINGESDFCISNGPLSGIYWFDAPGINQSDCISVDWQVSPSTGVSIYHGNSTGAWISFSEIGEFTITATLTACGQTIVRTKEVKVCDDLAYIPTAPPIDLQWLCFNELDEICYDFDDSWCISDFTGTTNDYKLLINTDGNQICLSDIWRNRRTSVINVTPNNPCGTGSTVSWSIYLNFPSHCEENDWGWRKASTTNEGFILANVNEIPIRFDLEESTTKSDTNLDEDKAYLEVFDLQGRILAQEEFTGNQPYLVNNNLPKGMLIARLSYKGINYVAKFIH